MTPARTTAISRRTGMPPAICSNADLLRIIVGHPRAGLRDFTFANCAPSYCTAATASQPVHFHPNKMK
jgi:hypothetical protein